MADILAGSPVPAGHIHGEVGICSCFHTLGEPATVMDGVCQSLHTGRLFVVLDSVGDSSSHFLARTSISLDEVREGRENQKRG